MILSALNQPDALLPAIIAYSIIVLLAFPLHEFAHAWSAVRLGDPTPIRDGRLTLDPRAHIDPIGALILAVGSFGWAKPVAFMPSNLRNAPSYKAGIVLVSLAGPAMNLLLAILAALPLRIASLSISPQVAAILNTIVIINLFLAVFNMIPLAPLDGSKILWGLMPDAWMRTYEQIQQYSLLILILLIFPLGGGGSLLGQVINPAVSTLYRVLLGF